MVTLGFCPHLPTRTFLDLRVVYLLRQEPFRKSQVDLGCHQILLDLRTTSNMDLLILTCICTNLAGLDCILVHRLCIILIILALPPA